jgi:hypothetical protein
MLNTNAQVAHEVKREVSIEQIWNEVYKALGELFDYIIENTDSSHRGALMEALADAAQELAVREQVWMLLDLLNVLDSYNE